MIVKKYSEGNKEKYNWSLLYTLGLDQQVCSSFVFGDYGNTSLCKLDEPLLAIRWVLLDMRQRHVLLWGYSGISRVLEEKKMVWWGATRAFHLLACLLLFNIAKDTKYLTSAFIRIGKILFFFRTGSLFYGELNRYEQWNGWDCKRDGETRWNWRANVKIYTRLTTRCWIRQEDKHVLYLKETKTKTNRGCLFRK